MRDDPDARYKVIFEYRDGITVTRVNLTMSELTAIGLQQDWRTIRHAEITVIRGNSAAEQ